MVYREGLDTPAQAPVKLRLGPLPPSWGSLGASFICFFLGAILVLVGFTRDHVRCHRDDSGGGACAVDAEHPLFQHRKMSFSIADVREIRWVPYTGDKGVEYGKTELITTSGRSLFLADGRRSGARRVHQQIDGFFRNEERRSLDVIEPHRISMGLWGIGLMIGWLAALVVFARSTTSVELVVEREALTLTARRRHFGVPGRARHLDLRGVVRASVEETKIVPWHHPGNSQGHPGYRVVLLSEDGTSEAVEPTAHRRRDIHERVASELEAVLMLGQSTEERPAEAGSHPAAVASGPVATAGANLDPGVASLARPTGAPVPAPAAQGSSQWSIKPYLLAPILLLVLVPPVIFFVFELTDDTTGTLEMRCEQRCKMGSSECLQGGHKRGPYKAGTYTVEVWNPAVPGNWEARSVVVKAGQHTTFVCRPSPSR